MKLIGQVTDPYERQARLYRQHQLWLQAKLIWSKDDWGNFMLYSHHLGFY